jgi:hypothetical protein
VEKSYNKGDLREKGNLYKKAEKTKKLSLFILIPPFEKKLLQK